MGWERSGRSCPFEPQNARAANPTALLPLRRSAANMFPYCTLHTVSFQSHKFAVINDLSPAVLNTCYTNPSDPNRFRFRSLENIPILADVLATSTVPKPTWPDNSQFSDAQVLIKYAKRAKVIRPSARSRGGALTLGAWRCVVGEVCVRSKSTLCMQEFADHGDDGVASKRDAIAAHAHAYVTAPWASHPSEQCRLSEAISPERTKCAVCRATHRVLGNANAGREPARRKVVCRRIG